MKSGIAFALLFNFLISVENVYEPGIDENPVLHFDDTIFEEGPSLYTHNGSALDVKHALYEMPSIDISYYNDHYAQCYQNAIRVSEPTVYYNCHTYAWLSSCSDVSVWLNSPLPFIDDGSATLISTPSVGDIICYFTSDGAAVHSGKVYSIDDEGNIKIISKWSWAGVYIHDIFDFPQSLTISYYNYYNPNHNYNNYLAISSTQHKSCCSCGAYTYESHLFRLNVCRKCRYDNSDGGGQTVINSIGEYL